LIWHLITGEYPPDIGGVGDYTLAMSSLFDLTGPSFAALRLPAVLAALAFSFGPAAAWLLRSQRRHLAATTAIALTSAVFLIAAQIAFTRFAVCNGALRKKDSAMRAAGQLTQPLNTREAKSIAYHDVRCRHAVGSRLV